MIKTLNNIKLINQDNNLFCLNEKRYLITDPTAKLTNSTYNEYNVDEAVLFNNRWDHNFRHFIIETFCGIHKFLNNNIKIILKKDCPIYNFQVLEILGLQNRIIWIQNKDCFKIKKLHITINKRIQFTKEINIFIKHFIKKCLEKSSISLKNKNVYLSREQFDQYTENYTPKRWVTNFDEIKNVFNGFKIIETHNMDLWDQVSLINQSENIITLIGAGCDNYIFCNPKCNFIVLYPDFCKGWNNILSQYKIEANYIGIQCGIYNTIVKYNSFDKSKDRSNGPWICFKKKIIIRLKKIGIWKNIIISHNNNKTSLLKTFIQTFNNGNRSMFQRVGLCIISHKYKLIYIPIPNCSYGIHHNIFKNLLNGEEYNWGNLNENIKNSYYVFTFVKDPIEKCISSYNKINRITGRGRSQPFYKLNDPLKRFISLYDNTKKYNHFLGKPHNIWDEHIILQSSFLFTKNGYTPIRFDLIEKLDNIEKVWEFLINKFNLPDISLDKYHFNKTNKILNKYDIDLSMIPPSYIEKLKSIYNIDYQLLNHINFKFT